MDAFNKRLLKLGDRMKRSLHKQEPLVEPPPKELPPLKETVVKKKKTPMSIDFRKHMWIEMVNTVDSLMSSGASVSEACRHIGIGERTYFRRKSAIMKQDKVVVEKPADDDASEGIGSTFKKLEELQATLVSKMGEVTMTMAAIRDELYKIEAVVSFIKAM